MSITNTKGKPVQYKEAAVVLRVLAFILDSVLVWIIAYYLADYLKEYLWTYSSKSSFSYYGSSANIIGGAEVWVAVFIAYHWVAELSSWKATPAKYLLGLRVVRAGNQEKASLAQVLGRLFGKALYFIIPPMLLGMVFALAKQDVFPVIIFTVVAWIVLLIIWSNAKHRCTLYDQATKTRVLSIR